jgi:hypothetical protein
LFCSYLHRHQAAAATCTVHVSCSPHVQIPTLGAATSTFSYHCGARYTVSKHLVSCVSTARTMPGPVFVPIFGNCAVSTVFSPTRHCGTERQQGNGRPQITLIPKAFSPVFRRRFPKPILTRLCPSFLSPCHHLCRSKRKCLAERAGRGTCRPLLFVSWRPGSPHSYPFLGCTELIKIAQCARGVFDKHQEFSFSIPLSPWRRQHGYPTYHRFGAALQLSDTILGALHGC